MGSEFPQVPPGWWLNKSQSLHRPYSCEQMGLCTGSHSTAEAAIAEALEMSGGETGRGARIAALEAEVERMRQCAIEKFDESIADAEGYLARIHELEARVRELEGEQEAVLAEAGKVYYRVTDGMVSKGNTFAGPVIDLFEEKFEPKEDFDALTQENERMRAAIREDAIGVISHTEDGEDIFYTCARCNRRWTNNPEIHEPGCLAAPPREGE